MLIHGFALVFYLLSLFPDAKLQLGQEPRLVTPEPAKIRCLLGSVKYIWSERDSVEIFMEMIAQKYKKDSGWREYTYQLRHCQGNICKLSFIYPILDVNMKDGDILYHFNIGCADKENDWPDNLNDLRDLGEKAAETRAKPEQDRFAVHYCFTDGCNMDSFFNKSVLATATTTTNAVTVSSKVYMTCHQFEMTQNDWSSFTWPSVKTNFQQQSLQNCSVTSSEGSCTLRWVWAKSDTSAHFSGGCTNDINSLIGDKLTDDKAFETALSDVVTYGKGERPDYVKNLHCSGDLCSTELFSSTTTTSTTSTTSTTTSPSTITTTETPSNFSLECGLFQITQKDWKSSPQIPTKDLLGQDLEKTCTVKNSNGKCQLTWVKPKSEIDAYFLGGCSDGSDEELPTFKDQDGFKSKILAGESEGSDHREILYCSEEDCNTDIFSFTTTTSTTTTTSETETPSNFSMECRQFRVTQNEWNSSAQIPSKTSLGAELDKTCTVKDENGKCQLTWIKPKSESNAYFVGGCSDGNVEKLPNFKDQDEFKSKIMGGDNPEGTDRKEILYCSSENCNIEIFSFTTTTSTTTSSTSTSTSTETPSNFSMECLQFLVTQNEWNSSAEIPTKDSLGQQLEKTCELKNENDKCQLTWIWPKSETNAYFVGGCSDYQRDDKLKSISDQDEFKMKILENKLTEEDHWEILFCSTERCNIKIFSFTTTSTTSTTTSTTSTTSTTTSTTSTTSTTTSTTSSTTTETPSNFSMTCRQFRLTENEWNSSSFRSAQESFSQLPVKNCNVTNSNHKCQLTWFWPKTDSSAYFIGGCSGDGGTKESFDDEEEFKSKILEDTESAVKGTKRTDLGYILFCAGDNCNEGLLLTTSTMATIMNNTLPTNETTANVTIATNETEATTAQQPTELPSNFSLICGQFSVIQNEWNSSAEIPRKDTLDNELDETCTLTSENDTCHLTWFWPKSETNAYFVGGCSDGKRDEMMEVYKDQEQFKRRILENINGETEWSDHWKILYCISDNCNIEIFSLTETTTEAANITFPTNETTANVTLSTNVTMSTDEESKTVPSTEATTESATIPSTEMTTESATIPSTEATTESTIKISTEATTESTTIPSTEATTESETIPSTQAITESIIIPSTEMTTESATIPSTEATTESATIPSTEATTESVTTPSTEASTDSATIPSTEATTESATIPSTEATTESATVPSTEASTESATIKSTEATTESARILSTEATTESTTIPSKEATTESAIVPSTEATTKSAPIPSTEATTESATIPSTEATTESVTTPSTEVTTEGPTIPSTEVTTEVRTIPSTTEDTKESATIPSTEITTEGPTIPSTEVTTEGPTIPSTTEDTKESATIPSIEITMESSALLPTESTKESSTVPSTESTTESAALPSTEVTSESATPPSTDVTTESVSEENLTINESSPISIRLLINVTTTALTISTAVTTHEITSMTTKTTTETTSAMTTSTITMKPTFVITKTHTHDGECLSEDKMVAFTELDSISALHIAANSTECQKTRLSSNAEIVRKAFQAAAKINLKSEEDLLSLIEGAKKLLNASQSRDAMVLSDNIKIWEKTDNFMNFKNMGDPQKTMKSIFEHMIVTNEAMNGWQSDENSVESEASDIMMEKKEQFAEHANNLVTRLTEALMRNNTFESTEVNPPWGYFGLIPVNVSDLSNQSNSFYHNNVKIPPLCAGDSRCGGKQEKAFVKIAAFESNLYDFVEPRRDLNGGSTNVSLLLAKSGTNIYEELEFPKLTEPIAIRFPIRNATVFDDTTLNPYRRIENLMAYHEVLIEHVHSSLIVVITKSNPNTSWLIYFHKNKLPWPTDYLDVTQFPNGQEKLFWSVNATPTLNESYILGIAQINSSSKDSINFAGHSFSTTFDSNYSIIFYSASCVFLDYDSDIQDFFWSSKGCRISEETTLSEVVCLCNHMSTFSAGIVVEPNTIDFDYVFANLSIAQNPSIYATLLIFFILYILFMVWGYRKGKKQKSNICIPLPNNKFNETYFYKISVKTGLITAASTDSVVRIVLVGKDGSTRVRRFPSSKELLRRGQTDHFLLGTNKSLGDLEFCRIWHDNSGNGQFASWFLQSVMVYDTVTQTSYHFICSKWLSREHKPNTTEQTLPVSNTALVQSYKLAVEQNLSKKLLHDHLWFSVVSLPKMSNFTRCQRITCCYCVILTTMLASAMWYGKKSDKPEKEGFELGPLTASWNEVFVGIASSLVVFPVNFTLVQLFKRAKPKGKQFGKEKGLPWWCTYIGWVLAFVTIVLSTFFILSYAIMMGDAETRRWLSSIFMSLFTSVFITQPLKVIILVIVISLVCRKIDVKAEEMAARAISAGVPSSDDALDKEGTPEWQRQLELKIRSLTRELIVTIILVVVCFILVHGNRDHNGYLLQSQVTQTLTNQPWRYTEGLDLPKLEVSTEDEFWQWAIDILVPALGGRNNLKKGLMSDNVNKVVGYAMIRQIRVEKDSCAILAEVSELFPDCVDFITLLNSENGNYGPKWSKEISKYRPEYQYVSATQLTTIPKKGLFGVYGGGGYTFLLRKWIKKSQKMLRNLKKEKWVDYQTRAIIVEFSIYNVQVNLFCVGHILVETPPTGGFVPSVHFRIVQLLKHVNLMQIIREVLFMITILIVIWSAIKNLSSIGFKRFFQSWDDLLDVAVIFLSVVIFVVYFMRWQETDRVMEIVNKTKGKAFVDMSYAAVLEETYNYVLGFVGFVATVKWVRLLRFSKEVSVFTDILVQAGSGVMGFAFLALIVMTGFAFMFYLLLGRTVEQFSTIFTCLEKCFGFVLFRADFFLPVLEAKPILGFICVSAYFCASLMLIDNIFITTLNTMIDAVKLDTDKQSSDYEVMEFAKHKVRNYTSRNHDRKMNIDMNRIEDDNESRLEEIVAKFERKIEGHLYCDDDEEKDTKHVKVIISD